MLLPRPRGVGVRETLWPDLLETHESGIGMKDKVNEFR